MPGASAPGRRGPTRCSEPSSTAGLREAGAGLVADTTLRGEEFGRALARLLDDAFAETLASTSFDVRLAVLAVGSYGRRELCPGSDVDVLLVHDAPERIAPIADALWYPMWDAGFVLGHATRTPKEAIASADADVETLTGLLDARLVAGDDVLAAELVERVRTLTVKRGRRLIVQLAAGAEIRRERVGPVAEMLEPNLKDGAGGLRDVHSMAWAGWALGTPGGVDTLLARGYLRPDDLLRLTAARDRLLDARVALHRVTGTRSDVLTLQEQDAVARLLGAEDADALIRHLAHDARSALWIASDVWERLRATARGPTGRIATTDRPIAPGIVERDGRVAFESDTPVDGTLLLRAAAAAAELGVAFDRVALERCREVTGVEWNEHDRRAFVALLRAGRRAVPVFEALDHVGVLARLLPEWEHVRSLPQRNAYHRFTVDRHLLEAVAECGALLDDPGFDGEIARRARPDVLLLAALLHDVGKGRPGDHSEIGARTAASLAHRLGIDDGGVRDLEWLVRNHLLLADTATRRDLSEESTILRFGRAVGTAERLDLLYALTVGDSRATGPAAWSPTKVILVRQLYSRTDSLLERGVVSSEEAARRRAALRRIEGAEAADEFLDAMPAAYTAAFEPAVLAHHRSLVDRRELTVEWGTHDDHVECTVVAPDRTGLLATVAGVLALFGFDIHDAAVYSHRDGMALEVFRGVDRFDRLVALEGRLEAETTLRRALSGEMSVADRLRERIRRYRPSAGPRAQPVAVAFDLEASDFATVVEVHAADEVGLLAALAATLADLDLDVRLAKVATLGDRVVDVFYVRDAGGQKITEALALDRLKATILARLTSDYALP